MFQPFVLFKPELIERLINLKRIYVVSQLYDFKSYNVNADIKTNILLSDYDDLSIAKNHLRTLSTDKFAAIIDLAKKSHCVRLHQILLPSSEYCVYWSSLYNRQELKRKIDTDYSPAIDYYLIRNTHWKNKTDEIFYRDLQVINGELYITIKSKTQSVDIKFRDIAELMELM